MIKIQYTISNTLAKHQIYLFQSSIKQNIFETNPAQIDKLCLRRTIINYLIRLKIIICKMLNEKCQIQKLKNIWTFHTLPPQLSMHF